jgi:hypothetical protein
VREAASEVRSGEIAGDAVEGALGRGALNEGLHFGAPLL